MKTTIRSLVITDLVLGEVITLEDFADGLDFHGDKKEAIQVVTFKYEKGHVLRNHRHIKRERLVEKTQEALIVLQGDCEVRVFDINDEQAFKSILKEKSMFISYYGGIGFTALSENTCMVEVKVGPYEVDSDDEDRVRL